MKCRINNQLGTILIDTDVIAKYAGSVAIECFGIVGMAAVNVKDGLVKLLKKESLAHGIYAGSDAFFVPSRFEPCGLTQLIAMHYGTVPIVRETGGLKDTVEPFNQYTGEGNGFTFDRYESGLLLDATNRAKTIYFEYREAWEEIVKRNMNKDVSWEVSAKQYRQLYVEMTQ